MYRFTTINRYPINRASIANEPKQSFQPLTFDNNEGVLATLEIKNPWKSIP